MSEAIQNAIREVAAVIQAVNGIARAPELLPEGINEYPFALTYVQSGTLEISSEGTRHKLFEIVIDVLTKRNNITRDMEILFPLLDRIPDALSAEVSTINGNSGDQFNNSIETFRSVTIEFVPEYVYQGVQHIAYRFTMQGVKFIQGD